MDITLNVKSASITPDTYKGITVKLEGVDKSELIAPLSFDDIKGYFTKEEMLDEIGIEACKSHFCLKEEGE